MPDAIDRYALAPDDPRQLGERHRDIDRRLDQLESRNSADLSALAVNVSSTVVPSGDVTGATDSVNFAAAFAAATPTFGTVTLAGRGPFYIDSLHIAPNGVNIWANGSGHTHSAARIICTTAGAGIHFGTRTTGGRGGLSGNFLVDGDGVATQPLFVGLTVARTFVAMESYRSAGDGITLEGTQNCTFMGCSSTEAAGNACVLDYGAAGNRWYTTELDSPDGDWFLVFRRTGDNPGLFNDNTYDNHFYNGIFERKGALGGVLQSTGADGNGIHGCQVVLDRLTPGWIVVKVTGGSFTVDGGILQTNTASAATTFDVATGLTLTIKGEPIVVGAGVVFANLGTVRINGYVRVVNFTVAYHTGNKPISQITSGNATLGSIPMLTAGSIALTTSLATTGAWWRLDPDDYPAAPDGRTLQYRFRALAQGLTAADVLGCALVIAETGSGLTTELTGTTGGTSDDATTGLTSAWATFPATVVGGYLWARNQTAARGWLESAFLDVRHA